MAKKYNHGTAWTSDEVKALRQLAKEDTPTRVIGIKLGRSKAPIQGKAHREQISLRLPPGHSKINFVGIGLCAIRRIAAGERETVSTHPRGRFNKRITIYLEPCR